MANVHTWATTPEPITLADGAYQITPLVSGRSAHATTYTLTIADRDGASLGYIHGYVVYHAPDGTERRPDPGQLRIDLRDWHDAPGITPAGIYRTLEAMRLRDRRAFQSILDG